MKKLSWKKLSFAILLITFGTLGRYLLLDMPNVETMTAVSLLAGALLGGGYALAVPLLSVALFDIFYGNSSILFFTWSAWAMIGLVGLLLRKRNLRNWKFTVSMTGLGVISSGLFYFWTNFGVWLIGDWYPKTIDGLTTCLVAGLPFIKAQIIGNLIVVPIMTLSLNIVWRRINVTQVGMEENKSQEADVLS